MLDKFWESIGTDLAKRWLDYLFGPAFLFWAGGFALYAWKTGWQMVLQQAQASTQFQQASWLVLALFVLALSSILMQALRFSILRLMEGYWPWPFHYLGQGIVALRKRFFQKKYDELRHLKSAETQGGLGVAEREKLMQLEVWAHWHPVKANDLLPTALGNVIRARERSPERKYGLDAIVCWPRLWPLLPENVRTDLANARASLDRLVELWFWGLLFLAWTFWTPWTLVISLLWMTLSYDVARHSAMAYGDLLESAFDLHRFSLYDALGWPRPKNTDEEKSLGGQLTEYLWRGTLSRPLTYPSRKA